MPHDKITSPQNTRVKQVAHLRDRKTRDQTNLMIVEGLREVSLAQKSGANIKELYFCPAYCDQKQKSFIDKLARSNTALLETDKKVFQKISFGDRHDGLLAICVQPKKAFDDMQWSGAPFFVVVERIEKPGNLGAILRTCDAAGVDGIIVCDGLTDIYNPNVVRASLGAIFTVSAIESGNEEAYNFLKKNKIKICTALPTAQTMYTKENLTGPLAVVLGSEQKGLSSFWIDKADSRIKIPMQGKIDSLNVSATTAIIVYEALRQRKR